MMSREWHYRLLTPLTGRESARVGQVMHFHDEDRGVLSIVFPTVEEAERFEAVVNAIAEEIGPFDAGVRLSVTDDSGEA